MFSANVETAFMAVCSDFVGSRLRPHIILSRFRQQVKKDTGAECQARRMSASLQKATVDALPRIDAIGHKETLAPRQKGSLFDYFIGALLEDQRHGYAQCLGGLQIDHQFKSARLLNRKIDRFRAIENLVHESRRLPELIRQVRTVRHEASKFDRFSKWIYDRQPMLSR